MVGDRLEPMVRGGVARARRTIVTVGHVVAGSGRS